MSNDIDIKLIGDDELMGVLRNLDFATQQRFLKSILRNTSTKTVVPFLRQAAPKGQTGNLRKSMGAVTGRSKSVATLFVGPRLSHRKTREGNAGFSGWVANILEFAKPQDRVPEKAQAFKPFFGGQAGPGFVKKVGPIKKKTNLTWAIRSRMRPAEVHMTKAVRTVIERAWKSKSKTYAQVKGRE